jgi:hypothetical protein
MTPEQIAEARIAELEAALKPFTAFDLPRDFPQTDDRPVFRMNHTELTLGDFRAARAALSGGKP